jgi:hypothetical protein
MPCHHTLGASLDAYIEGAGMGADAKSSLFRTIQRGTGRLRHTALPEANAYAMGRQRAIAAGVNSKIGNHTFRAPGITVYLKNGGTLEDAAVMANANRRRRAQRSATANTQKKSTLKNLNGFLCSALAHI